MNRTQNARGFEKITIQLHGFHNLKAYKKNTVLFIVLTGDKITPPKQQTKEKQTSCKPF
jgi:hypothetical protein